MALFIGEELPQQLKKMVLFVIVSVCVFLLDNSQCFNVDVKSALVTTGESGSLFGYSFAFDEYSYNRNKNITRLYVGAPKATTRFDQEDIKSGNVFGCYYRSGQMSCQDAQYRTPPEISFMGDSIEGEGYGSSLTLSPENVLLMCAPFWKDTKYVKAYNYTFMPGRCLKISQHRKASDISPFYHAIKSDAFDFYLPNTEYHHGLAAFGLSSDIYQTSQGKSVFLVGAPGLSLFEGGIYIEDITSQRHNSTDFGRWRPILTKEAQSYLGYDAKFGKFCDTDICFAAGAPNKYSYGMVNLYRWVGFSSPYMYQSLKGDKTWSYFGAVLCAVDVDNDQFDELLVGAPFYGEEDSRSFDKGRVYIFTRNHRSKLFEQQQILEGRGTKSSRFGSAIEHIGDINLDTYQDVAIGAPGEEHGTGCVYIYLGSSSGLNPTFSQRICANELDGQKDKLRAFGLTISGSIRLSNSEYPAFAVASCVNDTIAMFTTRPIVQLSVNMTAAPNPIDLEQRCDVMSSLEPCTVVTVCLSQKWIHFKSRMLKYNLHVDLDTKRRRNIEPRVELSLQQNSEVTNRLGSLSNITSSVEIDAQNKCLKYLLITKKSHILKDRFTPIEIKFTATLAENENNKEVKPTLDPTRPNEFKTQVSIANDCGSDNQCNVNLKVNGDIKFSNKNKEYPYVVVGLTKEVYLDLTVTNSKETSYGTEITIRANQQLPYLRFESDVIKHCASKGSLGAKPKTTVVCSSFQPLTSSSTIKLTLAFDATSVALDNRWLKFNVKAMPANKINTIQDPSGENEITKKTRVYIIAHVNMFGTSSPSEMQLKTAKDLSLTVKREITSNFTMRPNIPHPLSLNHKYQMKNTGPSFLPTTSMYVNIPAYIADGSQLVCGATVEYHVGESDSGSTCVNMGRVYVGPDTISPDKDKISTTTPHSSTTNDPSLQSTTEGFDGKPKKRRKRSTDTGIDYSKTYTLSCQTSPEYCVTFRCDLKKKIPNGGHVELNISLTIDRENIPIPKDFTSFYLQLVAFVKQPTHLLFQSWDNKDITNAQRSTRTVFHLMETGEEVNIWIIIGSVIAGVLLIIIIAIICWKCGFFKRNKKLEVDEFRRQSKRMSKPPESKGGEI